MRKYFMGLISGVIISASTAVYASDTLQAFLFPVDYKINEQVKVLGEEYVTLNYNGHAYVPVRFISENLGAYVNYDEDQKRININYVPASSDYVTDQNYPNVHVGVIKVAKDGSHTLIGGMVSVNPESNSNVIHTLEFSLKFFDQNNNLLGTFPWKSSNMPLKNGEIRYIMDSFPGDASAYSKVILEVTSFK
ncbi:stalk domain-containing protein [Paenibacillus puerhi]|uniref:stalk domain-containing protein n=1 Tax=Paenibacillus puerhi TaxID=2692622 RepID=UPI00135B9005|nr:stalk domain-containing protein [Paenibacillus puerhi]